MLVDDAFDIFQRKVDADPIHVRKARHRRDRFSQELKGLDGVKEVIPSGSLARGTQLDPIHDVDLILVFDSDTHPDWGSPGGSAATALGYVEEKVHELLGDQRSPLRQVVLDTLIRNHVVKCSLDFRFLEEDPYFKSFFAVEVMPAMRVEEKLPADAKGPLHVPERRAERWQVADPEWLIAKVRSRQERWRYFIEMIRVIKYWTRQMGAGMKPLAAEVLALECLPDSRIELSRSVALQRFFTAARIAVMFAITDPAGHCGVIQPDLRRPDVSGLLGEAADMTAAALAWESQGKHHQAICCWRAVFGEDFPLPPGGCPGVVGRKDHGEQARPTGQPHDHPRPWNDRRAASGPQPGSSDDPRSPDDPATRHGGDAAPDGGRGGEDDSPRRRSFIPPAVPPVPRGPVKEAPQG
jgi:hypothetical protein